MLLGQSKWNPFKKEDPKQLVRKWQANIRKEVRAVDRQVLGARGLCRFGCASRIFIGCARCDQILYCHNHADLQREQRNANKLIKDAAKRGDIKSAKASGGSRAWTMNPDPCALASILHI